MPIVSQISNAVSRTRTRVFLSDGGMSHLLLNVLKDFTENDSNEITNYAIEDGSDISDHIFQKPKTINLNAVLTDEIDNTQDVEEFINSLTSTIDNRMKMLQGWLDDKTTLTYCGYDNDIKDVLIESISRNSNQETGSGLNISISLKQINIANSMTVTTGLPKAGGPSAKSKVSAAGNPSQAPSILHGLSFGGK